MQYVVLAVDQAECSGWSVWLVDGPASRLLGSGIASSALERSKAVEHALQDASDHAAPLVPAFEQHRKHKGFGVKTAFALHRTLGRWLESLDLQVGATVRYAIVPIAKWRAFHGLHPGCGKSESVRASLSFDASIEDHNEAEAVLLGAYACQSEEVTALLPKRRRKKTA